MPQVEVAPGSGSAYNAGVRVGELQKELAAAMAQAEIEAPLRRLEGAKDKVARAEAALVAATEELKSAETALKG